MEDQLTASEPLEELPPLDDEPPTRPAAKAPAKPGKRGRRVGRSSTSSSESREGQLKRIGAELDQAFVLLGSAATPFLPVTGTILVARGPVGSDIIIKIARKDERVFRALLAISQYTVWGELAMFVGALGIAVTVDLGQTSPNSFIAQRMIGTDILQAVYGNRANGSQPEQPISAVPAGWAPTSPTA